MSQPVKVLSYNIHKGFSLSTQFVLSVMRDEIRSSGADIVFLQEVLGDHKLHAQRILSWPGPQLEFLADRVWNYAAYGKNAVYSNGHHGNAILSKYPILKWDNIDISNHRFESRGLLHAEIDFPLGPVHLLNVHLDLTGVGRKRQFKRIAHRISSAIPASAPLILAGDFNDWAIDASKVFEADLNLIEAHKTVHGTHAKTFPSMWPFLKLDRIYIRGFQPISAKTLSGEPWSKLSDHCAIETLLEPR